MKTVPSLEEFWKNDFSERKYYCISEEQTTSYPIQDNGEELIDTLNYFEKNGRKIYYDPPPEIKEAKIPLQLRKTAAELLLKAAQKLPSEYSFKVSEGYRPLWFQRLEFDKIYADMKQNHPEWDEKKLWKETTWYIADPNLTPPHSTGGTLDLTIIDNTGKELDMGNVLNTVSAKSNTFAEGLNEKQIKNRNVLFTALTEAGFVNCASEWWHYSYGDQYWAIFLQKPYAIYGSLEK